MEFQILKEEVFRDFLEHHPLNNFMQTPEIAKLREKTGWKSYYVGVVENKKVLAATLLLSHPRHFGSFEFYAPRGLLVDYEDEKVLSFFVTELKKFIKEKKGYILRIDPYYILRERDIDGNIVEGGVNHEKGVQNLRSLGFRKSKKNEQISWSFSLDLDQELDTILKNMRSFTRRSIKKGEKNHITLRDATFDEVPLVKEILDETSSRKHFSSRNLSYFENLYQLFVPKKMARFVIADIDLKKLLEEVNDNLKEEEKIVNDMKEKGAKQNKIQQHENTIIKLNDKLKEIKIYHEEYGDVVACSAGIFITYGNDVLYLFGGNKKELMHLGAPHFMQWEMIRYAKENKFKRYNFYGISGKFNPNDPSYGVYDFKKGFTGYVEELIGEYELVILPFQNFLFKLIHLIRK